MRTSSPHPVGLVQHSRSASWPGALSWTVESGGNRWHDKSQRSPREPLFLYSCSLFQLYIVGHRQGISFVFFFFSSKSFAPTRLKAQAGLASRLVGSSAGWLSGFHTAGGLGCTFWPSWFSLTLSTLFLPFASLAEARTYACYCLVGWQSWGKMGKWYWAYKKVNITWPLKYVHCVHFFDAFACTILPRSWNRLLCSFVQRTVVLFFLKKHLCTQFAKQK